MYYDYHYEGCFLVLTSIVLSVALVFTTIKNISKPDDIQSIEQLAQIINIDELELGDPINVNDWLVSTKKPKKFKIGKHTYIFYKYVKSDCVYSLPKKPKQHYDVTLAIATKLYKISGNKELYNAVNDLLTGKKKSIKGQITIIVFIKKWSILPNELIFYTGFNVE